MALAKLRRARLSALKPGMIIYVVMVDYQLFPLAPYQLNSARLRRTSLKARVLELTYQPSTRECRLALVYDDGRIATTPRLSGQRVAALVDEEK